MIFLVVRTLGMALCVLRIAEVVLHTVGQEAPSNLVVGVVLRKLVAADMPIVVHHRVEEEVHRMVAVEGVRRRVAEEVHRRVVEEVDCNRLEGDMESENEEDTLQPNH
jgi:hypothetical protein